MSFKKEEKLNKLNNFKEELLNKDSDCFIFKEFKGNSDIWLEKCLAFLKDMDTVVFLECIEQKPLALLNTFDLKHLWFNAIDSKNENIKEYIQMIPDFNENKKDNSVAQSQHLLSIAMFATYIYCQKKGFIYDETMDLSLSFYALAEVFNIIDKEFPNTISFENWFRKTLSY